MSWLVWVIALAAAGLAVLCLVGVAGLAVLCLAMAKRDEACAALREEE